MLIEPQTRGYRGGRRRQSLRQEYGEFILERIEEFKEQLSREELLALADEAVRELEVGPEGQLVLTEVLVLEHVDRLIMRRLNLPSFRRWRERHTRLRRAQREPTHWGLDRHSPLARVVHSLEAPVALAVGPAATSAGFFLAAYEWPVVFIDRRLSVVEAAETRAATEALARWFQALVVNLGEWFPDLAPFLTVLDPASLHTLSRGARARFLETLKARTRSGGMHLVLPEPGVDDQRNRRLEVLRTLYGDWRVNPSQESTALRWLLAVKP